MNRSTGGRRSRRTAGSRAGGAARGGVLPRAERWLLYRLLPRELREEAVAELDEKFFDYIRAGHGDRWARRWYRRQVLGSLHPALWRRGRQTMPHDGARAEKGKTAMISDWIHDVRFGLRMLAKTPAMTLVIVVTLAVGIGFNGAIFSLANTIMLNDLPLPEPKRLAFVRSMNLPQGQGNLGVSYPDYRDFAAAARSFDSLAAWALLSVNLGDEADAPQRLEGALVAPSMFDVLRVEPALGRRLAAADAEPGAPAVALLGYGLWQSRYGGAASVVGSTVRVNGSPHTVIGVLPQPLEQTPFRPAVWVPLVRTEEREARRGARSFLLVGRLAAGVTHEQADVEIRQLAALSATEHPEDNEGVSAAVRRFSEAFTEDANRIITLILLGAVGVLLLISCANVANLLISRAVERVSEMGIRSALGASRWRVVRQMLVESLLLSALGGVAAVALAVWGARSLEAAIMLADPPEYWDFSVQPSVYAFIAVLSVVTSLVFGLAPALHASRNNTSEVLKENGRGSESGGARRLTGGLVVVQLALAVILLTSAGVMIRSTHNIRNVEWTIDPDNVVTMEVTLPTADYPERQQKVAFHDELRRRISGLPQVQSYALTMTFPGEGGYTAHAQIESLQAGDDDAAQMLQQQIVGPEYFDMAGVRPLRGRLFTDADGYESEPVVVVEERLAQTYWPDEDPIGQRLRWVGEEETRWLTVIGVVPDIRQTVTLEFTGDYPVVYTPYRQETLRTMGIMIRSSMGDEAVAEMLRQEVLRLDPNLPVFNIATLRSVFDERSVGFRIISALFLMLGGIALFLSCIGIYAVMAFAVGRRRQEIGIRVALGARRRAVLGLVLRRAMFQTIVGMFIGLSLALAATRLLSMYLYEVSPNDPATFAVTVVVLMATALLASLVPARRAGRVDPLAALRTQ